MAKDHHQHVFAACAERHTNADFARTLADVVGDNAKNSHGREQERGAAKSTQNGGEKSRLRDGVVEHLLQRGHAIDGLVRLEVMDGLADGRGNTDWVAAGAGKQIQILPWRETLRHVNGGATLLFQSFIANVAHNADHFEFRLGALSKVQEFPDRVFAGPEMTGKLLIDDEHAV
jgi:hypothetical protein